MDDGKTQLLYTWEGAITKAGIFVKLDWKIFMARLTWTFDQDLSEKETKIIQNPTQKGSKSKSSPRRSFADGLARGHLGHVPSNVNRKFIEKSTKTSP